MPIEIKKLILAEIECIAYDFVYYNRKEDEELPCGAIENQIASGEITIEEMSKKFEKRNQEAIECR